MKTKRKSSSSSQKPKQKEKESKTNNDNDDKLESQNTETNNTYNILRINCIENIPSSIEDIFTLTELNILALCRSDNTIEIWTTDTWIQLLKFPGLKNIQTRRIWLTYKNSSQINNNIFNYLRLFTVGLNGYFIEWSFETLLPKFTFKNNGGAIWDFKIKNKLCLLG